MTPRIEDIRSGEFRIRAECFRAYRRDAPLDLRPRELLLLLLFLQNRGKVLTRAQIRDAFDSPAIEDDRSVDVYVMRLRKALTTGRMWDPIETVKLRGYRFRNFTKSERPPQRAAFALATAATHAGAGE